MGFVIFAEEAERHLHFTQRLKQRRRLAAQAGEGAEAIHNDGVAAVAIVHQHVQRLHARRPRVAHHVVVRRHVLRGVGDVVAMRIDGDVVDALEHHLAQRPQARRQRLQRAGLGWAAHDDAGAGDQELLDEGGRGGVVGQELGVVEGAGPEPTIPIAQRLRLTVGEPPQVHGEIAGAVAVWPYEFEGRAGVWPFTQAHLVGPQIGGHARHVKALLRGLRDAAGRAIAVVAQPEIGDPRLASIAPSERQHPTSGLHRVEGGQHRQASPAGQSA